ncbi:UDP-glucuronic acid decarboxylase family protein [uncultured Hoeflea sp.]|uniref:UDP-glucuronic acid decarboxylase family protein n=1 Tax=uncultured Hoeflea sp. TaxID=538666 RepID=UPI0030ED4EDA|tara:strand:+ start:133296 stop:134228 length:933 start_codon:yes stop_codon:yes gene_type:complete
MALTAIVAGGAGFLGSHLCDRLLSEGRHVICVDDLSTGSEENVAHLASESRFELLRHDILVPLRIKADEVYNLACPASPPKYQLDPIRTTQICVTGTNNLLELARHNNALFFQASTSEVYGDPEVHPQPESYRGCVNPTGIRACYDEGKRCAETLCFDYHRFHGLDVRVVRIFNTYGPRMAADDGRVVTNFINQALNGEDITIYGNGAQTRSFCYVDDLIDAFRLFASSELGFPGPLNTGNPEEYTMIELASLVIELTGSSSKLVYRDLPEDDPRQRCPDITLAKEKFGWSPRIGVREGLTRTIEHFRSL